MSHVQAFFFFPVVEEGEQWDVGIKCSESSSIRDSMEVFVSAVEHPGHFWVQIITASSLQLDKMTDDMTSFYNNSATAQVKKRENVIFMIVCQAMI